MSPRLSNRKIDIEKVNIYASALLACAGFESDEFENKGFVGEISGATDVSTGVAMNTNDANTNANNNASVAASTNDTSVLNANANTAANANVLDAVLLIDSQLSVVLKAYYAGNAMHHAFEDGAIDADTKKQMAVAAFGELNEGLAGVLSTMAAQGDFELLPRVKAAFVTQAEQKVGAVIVDITTAIALDEHLRQVIKNKLSKDFQKDVLLRESVDPSIVGGIIMSAHGRRIDASVSSRLEEARELLASTLVSTTVGTLRWG